MHRTNFTRMLVVLSMLFVASHSAMALVQSPDISIQNYTSDTGTIGSSGTLNIDATALSITTATSTTPISEDFKLSAIFSSLAGSTYNYNNGTFSLGTSLLTGTFTNLAIYAAGGGNAIFSADLTYTGGSMMGSLTSGRIEGNLFGIAGNLDGDFTSTNTFANLGAVSVVPLPAAVWLFAPMLAGLFGFAKEKRGREKSASKKSCVQYRDTLFNIYKFLTSLVQTIQGRQGCSWYSFITILSE